MGKLGEPEKILSGWHLTNDVTILVTGTKRGNLGVYESKNLLENDFKFSSFTFDKKDNIRSMQAVRRGTDRDIYFANDESLFWF